ncbi:MAG: hypothetical protein LBI74_00420 [Synergistaceae bacterium]|jgi:hypothetical protein|nr:hypothetical protein [Synergistaceae bacterium]
MKAQKQQRMYGVLVAITIVLLLVAQFLLRQALTGTAEELESVKANLNTLRQAAESKSGLVEKYKQFEAAINPSNSDRTYPANGSELYGVLNGLLTEHGIMNESKSSTSGTAAGGVLQLQITFNGSYYGLLKALAAIRESRYVMRISDFRIDASEAGQVSGSMTVLSTASS